MAPEPAEPGAPIHFGDRMSDADSLMWTVERNPALRSTITAVATLLESPDREQLQWRIDRASRRIPRLRQRVVANPMSIAPPRWEYDPNFNLSYHLRSVTAGGSGTLRDVLDFAQPIAMQGFDRARPLWEFTLVDGLVDDKAALIMKVHHAITDGVGAVQMMLETFSFDETIADRSDLPAEPEAVVMGQGERMRDAVSHEARRQMGIAKRTVEGLRRIDQGAAEVAKQAGGAAVSAGRLIAPSITPLSPQMIDRSLSVHFDVLTLPVADLKEASAKADAKLNAAFVAGVARGMRRYHEHHGEPISHLRMGMPINNRNDDAGAEAGNQFTPARIKTPIDIVDPVEHMATINRLTAAARDEPGQSLVEPMANVLRRMPKLLTTSLFAMAFQGVDFTTSNVPGIPVPMYLEGAPVTAQFPFGPLSGAAANLTLLSYCDDVHIGINVDTAAITDSDVFLGCIEEGFAEVLG